MMQKKLEEYRRQKRKKAIGDWLAFTWNRAEVEEFTNSKSAMDEKVRLCRGYSPSKNFAYLKGILKVNLLSRFRKNIKFSG